MELIFVLVVVIGLVFLLGGSLSRTGPPRTRTRRMPQVPAPASWPPPDLVQQPAYGWQPPSQPVLPAVTRADVTSLRDRLAHDVTTLAPGEDRVARQALADASERYSTANTILERATSDAQLRTAWLAAVEGLQAARVVRERLGLDPGAPLPPLPTHGPPLVRHADVRVEGRTYSGAPSYEPGRPHWFPGGSHGGQPVPAGWYGVPFWPSALVLGGLSGWALGGMLAGPMYADDPAGGEQFGGFGGGDLGGGGDWDTGGGDFGGFGGGGDWGGGGDFGGGGDW